MLEQGLKATVDQRRFFQFWNAYTPEKTKIDLVKQAEQQKKAATAVAAAEHGGEAAAVDLSTQPLPETLQKAEDGEDTQVPASDVGSTAAEEVTA